MEQVNFRSRCRRQSPHPVDILKGQAAPEISRRPPKQTKEKTICSSSAAAMHPIIESSTLHPTHQSTHDADDISPCDDGIPDFTISENLESTESAQELRRLLEALKTEFLRLRDSKMQAEDRALRLQTELILQQQKIERIYESVYTQNEQLKNAANASQIKLEHAMDTINRLENEICFLKGKKREAKNTSKHYLLRICKGNTMNN